MMESVILSQTQILCSMVWPKIVKGYIKIPYRPKELPPASLKLGKFEFLDLKLKILIGNRLHNVLVFMQDFAAPVLDNQL